MTEDATVSTGIDRDRLADGMLWLIRGIAVTSIAMPLSLLEPPAVYGASVFGPVGAVLVLVGIRRITGATPASRWSGVLLWLAVAGVPLRIGSEGLALVRAADGGGALGPVAGWGVTEYVALATAMTTVVGVLALARHCHAVLVGVAADRWRQVTFGWLGGLAFLALALLVGGIELAFLAGATLLIAGVLLLLSLLATYRAALDDTLDAEFPSR